MHQNSLCCDKQSGINHNEDYAFLTLLRYAHKYDPNARNPYLDWYDEKSGNYYYVRKGVNGDRLLTGINEKIANTKETGTKIHFFGQHAINNDHQYIRQMNMQTYD